ncbi:S-adenosyl-L-methionine-dependent methyltransferase [Mycena leptocephala]|nr:S-adenosyl-L-methionine-dependent methyltransferase [Mycena leptocephala]
MAKPDEDDDCYFLCDEGFELFYEMHGRKFNALNPTYLLPVDDEEIKRFDLFHRLMKFVLCGRLYVGPVRRTLQFGDYRKVLDLGTGRGHWAVEMCELFSWVYVTGVDVVPIQFTEVPPRCQFEIWDINTHDMPYADGYFDLIHARAVFTGIRHYTRFLHQIARLLRPGGLANNKPEVEYTFGSGPRGWFTLWETYRSCLASLEVDVTVPQRLGRLLEDTRAFENIEVREGIIPVGFYPENSSLLTMGQLQWMEYDLLLPSLKPMFLHLGLLESEVDQIIEDAQRDLYHGHFELSSRIRIAHATKRFT